MITESSPADLTLSPKKLKLEHLQTVIEDYIKWVQNNNCVLRLPNQFALEHSRECFMNVQLDIHVKRGIFERSGEVVYPVEKIV